MEEKYNMFIKLLNFNPEKYTQESVFKDFVSMLAIKLSNDVVYNRKNNDIYNEIMKKYNDIEQYYFYALSFEMKKILCREVNMDILGEIYKEICSNQELKLNNSILQEVGKKVQGIMNINPKEKNGKMVEVGCKSGGMILAYARTLEMLKPNYTIEVTAIDTNIINVFMTYIQLYFNSISAVVILADESNNKELMRLYTPAYLEKKEVEYAMAA